MDIAEVVNYTNMTFDEEEQDVPHLPILMIVEEAVFTILAGIGILTNITAVYTINHFKKLRTTTNLLFASWAIADTIALFANPSIFRLIQIIDDVRISLYFICAFMQVGFLFHNVGIFFISLISIDWCISSYFENAVVGFRKGVKIVTVITWCTSVVTCIITIRLCVLKIATLVVLVVLLINYALLLLLIISLQTFKCAQRCRKVESRCPTFMLTISTTYTMCWLVGLINFAFIELLFPINVITFILECAVFGSSIVNFALLYKYNKTFQACVVQLLKRPRNRYNDNFEELDVYEGRSNNPL